MLDLDDDFFIKIIGRDGYAQACLKKIIKH